jgi:hypothetical protein
MRDFNTYKQQETVGPLLLQLRHSLESWECRVRTVLGRLGAGCGSVTGYKKAPFEGEYQTPDGIKLGIIRLMAEQGFPESQWRLYDESGRQPEDIIWLCRSADNGYAKAQLYVGRLYWDASYIHQNKIKAYVWYKLAATGDKLEGLSPDKVTQRAAWEVVYDAEKTLTPEQLAEARILYIKWQPGQCERDLMEAMSEKNE